MSECPHIKRISEYDGDTEEKCGLVPGLSCWGPDAAHCPRREKNMNESKTSDVHTLADALPEEINRVQEIIALYKTVPNGQFAAALMQQDIDAAHKAMMEGDLAGMITAYRSLKEWKNE